MGKKGTASYKRDRRIAESNIDYEEQLDKLARKRALQELADTEIFVLDRQGSKSVRKRVTDDAAVAKRSSGKSKTEHTLIKKRVKALLNGETTKHQQRLAIIADKQATKAVMGDPWGNDIFVAPVIKMAPVDIVQELTIKKAPAPARAMLGRKKIIKPASHGMSYNPSEQEHQDLLAEALALEMKHREQKAKDEGEHERSYESIENRGVSEPIVSLNANTDDSETSDDSDDAGSERDDDGPRKLSRKERSKLTKKTKAQRNQDKLKRAAARIREKDAEIRRLVKEMNNAPIIAKEVEKQANLKAAAKELKLRQREAQQAEDAKALSYDEAGHVPLSDELRGSLRTIIPKGNSTAGMQRSFVNAGEVTAKGHRKQKVGEHPHKARNIKWVAKYKYT